MPNYTDTKVNQIIFNVLDSARYNTLSQNSELNNNELYLITDDEKQISFTKNGATIDTYYPSVDHNVTIDLTDALKDGNEHTIVNYYLHDVAVTSNASNAVLTKTIGTGETSSANLPKATTGVYGVTKLSSTASSTEQGLAATPKLVYDSVAQVSANLASVFTFKGTKASTNALPTTGNNVGDVWHVTDNGGEYVWASDNRWELLGLTYDLSHFVTSGSSTSANTTGISVADHTTTTIYGVKEGTVPIIGVDASTATVRGVKTGTNSTTTASKVTLGTALTASKLKTAPTAPSWTFENVTVPIRDTAVTVPIKSATATDVPIVDKAYTIKQIATLGSASTWSFENKTVATLPSGSNSIEVPKKATEATTIKPVATLGSASTWTFESKTVATLPSGNTSVEIPIQKSTATTIPNVTGTSNVTVPIAAASATACDDITSWNAGSGSATLQMQPDANDPKKLNITFVHTHTSPTLSYTARSITGVSGSTTASKVTMGDDISVIGVTGTTKTLGNTTVYSKSGGGNSTAPTWGNNISIIGVQDTVNTLGSTTVSSKKAGANSTAPTWDDNVSIIGVKSTTNSIYGVESNTTSVTGVKTGDNSTVTASHVTGGNNGVAPTFDSVTIPNVTNVASVTVPIANDEDTVVPIKSTTTVSVPIRNDSTTTVVTGKTHSVTDPGHSHTV